MERIVRPGEPLPGRVAVVRALKGMGDILCAVPALRALRTALPEAHIALVGLLEVAPLVARFAAYVDELLEFPGFPGIPEKDLDVRGMPGFLSAVHAREFDLALQMHGNGSFINPFTLLLGARRNAGFYLPGQYCPDPERFLAYPETENEIWRHLRLMEFLGVPLCGDHLEFPVYEEDHRALQALPEARRLRSNEFVCIHPGASVAERRWPAAYFAQVANELARRGLQVVLTGTAGEAELTRAVARGIGRPVLDLAGRTSVEAIAALLTMARLLISNDTGVSHLAAALGVPSVVVFSGSDPQRWAPLDRSRHRVVGAGLPDVRAVPAPWREGGDGAPPEFVWPAHGAWPQTRTCEVRDEVRLRSEGMLEATPENVLAQADALLWEYTHAA